MKTEEIKRINQISDTISLLSGDKVIVNGGVYTYVNMTREKNSDEKTFEFVKNTNGFSDTLLIGKYNLDGKGGLIAQHNSRTFDKGVQQ